MTAQSRFKIYSGAELVGWSDFEGADPPMGVVWGRFEPTPSYDSVRSVVVDSLGARDRCGAQARLSLSVRTPEDRMIESYVGLWIRDQSAELGAEGLEVELLGVRDYALYFPEHAARYCGDSTL